MDWAEVKVETTVSMLGAIYSQAELQALGAVLLAVVGLRMLL